MPSYRILYATGILLFLLTASRGAAAAEDGEVGGDTVAVRVDQVLLVNNSPAVLLSAEEDESHLLVFIDHFMAQAIQLGLMGYTIERPLTHDLIGILLRRLGARVDRITITDLRNNTYFALITLRVNGDLQEIDARPSDALAIAVRSKAPIYVNRELMSDKAFPGELLPAPASPSENPGKPKHDA